VRSDLAHAPQGRFQCGDDGRCTIPIPPARWPGAPVEPAEARWHRPPQAASSHSPFVEAPRSSARCGRVYSMVDPPPAVRAGLWCCRVGTRSHRSRLVAHTQLVRAVTGTRKVHPLIQFAAGATFQGRDPSSTRRLATRK
jgi:hypothetical protein